MAMTSGGARARSGPAPDPNSYRSQNRDWVMLPAAGFVGDVPGWPFEPDNQFELDMWSSLWRKPQAVMWDRLGLADQVAAYVRAYVESVAVEASSSLKTAVLRMETELGISVAGMRQNGWLIEDVRPAVSEQPAAARRTSSGDWLKAVSVEGA